jgi:hypothetical protein
MLATDCSSHCMLAMLTSLAGMMGPTGEADGILIRVDLDNPKFL